MRTSGLSFIARTSDFRKGLQDFSKANLRTGIQLFLVISFCRLRVLVLKKITSGHTVRVHGSDTDIMVYRDWYIATSHLVAIAHR